MKCILLLLCTFSLVELSYSQFEERYSPYVIAGSRVKSISINIIYAVKRLKKIKPNRKHQYPFGYLYEFDQSGNLTRSTETDGPYVYYDTLFTYNNEHVIKLYTRGERDKNEHIQFNYNTNGKLRQKLIFDENNKEIRRVDFIYLGDNKWIEYYFEMDSLQKWTTKEINGNGLLIDESRYEKDSILKERIEFTYDKNRNLISEFYCNDELNLGYTLCFYDENNLMVKEITEDYNRSWLQSIECNYTYEYDVNKNWVKKKCHRVWYSNSLKTKDVDYFIIEREITYYE